MCESFRLHSAVRIQLTRDIYNFIANSPKHTAEFDEIQVLFDDKPHTILQNKMALVESSCATYLHTSKI